MKWLLSVAIIVGSAVLALCADPLQKPSTNALTDAILDRAERALRRNAHREAVEVATSVISAEPTNARAHLLRGQAYEDLREHDKAVADFSEVLKRESRPPMAALVYQHRGFEQFKLGHVKEAIADFDRFLEVQPAQAPFHWQRGIALYYAGRFEDGRKQFELHQTVNPNDVENAVWHYLCVARNTGIAKARASLMDIKGDGRVPMEQIYALFGAKGSPDEVLAAADAGKPSSGELKNRLFYAHLYLGLYFEANGNAERAQEHISKAAGPYAQEHYMGDVARVHLMLFRSGPKNRL